MPLFSLVSWLFISIIVPMAKATNGIPNHGSNKKTGDQRYSAGSVGPSSSPPSPLGDYKLTHVVNSSNFLDFFNFYVLPDPTHGDVIFVGKNHSIESGMVKTDNGQIYMSADRKHDVLIGDLRESIRVYSKTSYNGGLFIIDLEHMPAGCGTWPGFWTHGPLWPQTGEIDIIEGVNEQTGDQTTLHTRPNCNMYKVPQSSMTGHYKGRNCCASQTGNAGCGIKNNDPNSYGRNFNDRQGGVVAMVWDVVTGIKVYNWERSSIPSNIRSNPNPDEWGRPYANFEFGFDNCNPTHIVEQRIIFDLTFCGDWAGHVFEGECPGRGSCNDYIKRAENVQEAYWVVNYIDIFQRGLDSWEMTDEGYDGVKWIMPNRTRGYNV